MALYVTTGYWTAGYAEGETGGALTGASTLTFTASGALTGTGALAGASTLTFALSGALTGVGALSGTTSLTFAPVGTLTGQGALAGSSTLSFTGAGTLAGTGALAGQSSLTFVPAGILTGAGALSGATTLTFTPAGTLTGDGALAGSAALVFVLAGTLSEGALEALSGSTSLTFTVSGTLSGGIVFIPSDLRFVAGFRENLLEKLGVTFDYNENAAGNWRAIAEALEDYASLPVGGNNNIRGYQYRAALAYDEIAGTPGVGFNKNEPGHYARLVEAMETHAAQTETGSLERRLLKASELVPL